MGVTLDQIECFVSLGAFAAGTILLTDLEGLFKNIRCCLPTRAICEADNHYHHDNPLHYNHAKGIFEFH